MNNFFLFILEIVIKNFLLINEILVINLVNLHEIENQQFIRQKKKKKKIMKFEQLLKIYWSKSFVLLGKTYLFNENFNFNFKNTYGISIFFFSLLIKRFEFKPIILYKLQWLFSYTLNYKKLINIFFSKSLNINNFLKELILYYILKLYLIKSYKGFCHILGKPVKGQRTWSNAWMSYKKNLFLRMFYVNINKKNKNTINIMKYNNNKKFKLIKKKEELFFILKKKKLNVINKKLWL